MWRSEKGCSLHDKAAKTSDELFDFYLLQNRPTLGFTTSAEKGEVNKLDEISA